jgi:hypothetical protein
VLVDKENSLNDIKRAYGRKRSEVLERGTEKSGLSFASPITGLNDNLQFMGRQLHVQTEHLEFPTAHIVTQVFCNGRVLLSKKSEYPSDVRECRDVSKIQQLMHAQHSQVIREIADKQARILASH